MTSAYHPAYGYTDAFRMKVCLDALKLGKRAAATKHNVSLPSVYMWAKVYSYEALMRLKMGG